jgi:hypothetical protein
LIHWNARQDHEVILPTRHTDQSGCEAAKYFDRGSRKPRFQADEGKSLLPLEAAIEEIKQQKSNNPTLSFN